MNKDAKLTLLAEAVCVSTYQGLRAQVVMIYNYLISCRMLRLQSDHKEQENRKAIPLLSKLKKKGK